MVFCCLIKTFLTFDEIKKTKSILKLYSCKYTLLSNISVAFRKNQLRPPKSFAHMYMKCIIANVQRK